jgi:Tol biopolymer transport system component
MRQPFAISPDGRRFVFIATGQDGTHIWVRYMSSLDMRPVPGTDGAESLFWSPDSRSVYFPVKHTLKQVDLDTGAGHSIGELPDRVQIGTWKSPNDLFLFLGRGAPYFEYLVDRGSITKTEIAGASRWPQFLPGGQRFVFLQSAGEGRYRAALSDYSTRKSVPLIETDSIVQYAPPPQRGHPAHLLYLKAGSLMAQPFDPDSTHVTSQPFPIAPNVIYYLSTMTSSFSASDNGTLVYQSDFPVTELKWYDRHGNDIGSAGRPATYWGTLRLSPDGHRVAAILYNSQNGGNDTWLFDAAGREAHQLTFPQEVARRPVWSPDGKRLVIGVSISSGGMDLATLELDGSRKETPIAHDSKTEPLTLPTDWSADGRFIAFDQGIPEDSPGAWIADLQQHQYIPILPNDKFPQWGIAFSPDIQVRQIAFVTPESGRPEVYLQAFEKDPTPHLTGERRQVSRDGAWLVRWNRNGRELFYLGLDNKLYSVPVTGLATFGNPDALFRIPGTQQYDTTRDFQFDVSPDGQRFLMTTTGSVPPPPFTVIQNWQDKFRH